LTWAFFCWAVDRPSILSGHPSPGFEHRPFLSPAVTPPFLHQGQIMFHPRFWKGFSTRGLWDPPFFFPWQILDCPPPPPYLIGQFFAIPHLGGTPAFLFSCGVDLLGPDVVATLTDNPCCFAPLFFISAVPPPFLSRLVHPFPGSTCFPHL